MQTRTSSLTLGGLLGVILAAASLTRGGSLADLVLTNKPGNYALDVRWRGFEKVTTNTGWYATSVGQREHTNRWLRFDRFVVHPRPDPWGSNRQINDSKSMGMSSSIYGYRASLPTDQELLALRWDWSLTNLIGFNPFRGSTNTFAPPHPPWGSSSSYRFFTLGRSNAIETLHVTFLVTNQGASIDGVVIKRALVTPEGHKP